MNNRKIITIPFFILVALVQLAVPGYMIYRHENILKNGKVYKFRTAMVDPADPFRGRYVRLSFNYQLKRGANEWPYGKEVNAIPAIGSDGFAYIAAIAEQPPIDGIYFPARVGWGNGKDMIRINPLFDRFYLNEKAAPKAEKLYQQAVRNKNDWVEVRIKDGNTAIVDLYLDGKPILDVVGAKE